MKSLTFASLSCALLITIKWVLNCFVQYEKEHLANRVKLVTFLVCHLHFFYCKGGPKKSFFDMGKQSIFKNFWSTFQFSKKYLQIINFDAHARMISFFWMHFWIVCNDLAISKIDDFPAKKISKCRCICKPNLHIKNHQKSGQAFLMKSCLKAKNYSVWW